MTKNKQPQWAIYRDWNINEKHEGPKWHRAGEARMNPSLRMARQRFKPLSAKLVDDSFNITERSPSDGQPIEWVYWAIYKPNVNYVGLGGWEVLFKGRLIETVVTLDLLLNADSC